jgi:histidinol dehydrogenase
VNDFVRLITVQEYSAKGLASVASDVTALARAEGLIAHAQSINIRMGTS